MRAPGQAVIDSADNADRMDASSQSGTHALPVRRGHSVDIGHASLQAFELVECAPRHVRIAWPGIERVEEATIAGGQARLPTRYDGERSAELALDTTDARPRETRCDIAAREDEEITCAGEQRRTRGKRQRDAYVTAGSKEAIVDGR